MSFIGPSAQGPFGASVVIMRGALVSNRPTSREVTARRNWVGRVAIMKRRRKRGRKVREEGVQPAVAIVMRLERKARPASDGFRKLHAAAQAIRDRFHASVGTGTILYSVWLMNTRGMIGCRVPPLGERNARPDGDPPAASGQRAHWRPKYLALWAEEAPSPHMPSSQTAS